MSSGVHPVGKGPRSHGARRAGSDRIVGVPVPPKQYGTYKEFQRKDYLPAERTLRNFLEEVAYRGNLQLSYKSQYLLARYWKCILPRVARRLTPEQRAELAVWVPGTTICRRDAKPKG